MRGKRLAPKVAQLHGVHASRLKMLERRLCTRTDHTADRRRVVVASSAARRSEKQARTHCFGRRVTLRPRERGRTITRDLGIIPRTMSPALSPSSSLGRTVSAALSRTPRSSRVHVDAVGSTTGRIISSRATLAAGVRSRVERGRSSRAAGTARAWRV